MDKEGFLDAVRKQYVDEIRQAYTQHNGTRGVDYGALDRKLGKLRKAAKLQGLKPTEFDELVRAALPGMGEKIAA